jgi:7,8-dihydropterin-6-yl-methyl-4-(beta-D-ribofuranosyl)aminobenzene 5'-phosphate synthase
MAVKKVEIAVLITDSSLVESKLKSEHGLAFFIQAKIGDKEVTIMMDTGPSSDHLLRNADKMDINLQKTDIVTISHGHYDHTGGLIGTLKKIEKRVLVIAHPNFFNPKLKIMPHLRFLGTPFKPSDIECAGGVPILVTDPVKIANGITTTGEVQRRTTFEKIRGFLTVHNRRLVEDFMLDDQALIIDVENKGLVVVVGCAHSGIINTIKHAQKITETQTIHALLGGFHLINADDERIQATVDELKKLDLKFIGPCHCTGTKATEKIAEVFGDRCRPLCTGDIVKL